MNLTYTDLMQIVHTCAGTDETAAPGSDAIDTAFDQLGYDSLALLETASYIEREIGVTLPDDAVATHTTPRLLLEAIHSQSREPSER